MEIKYNFIPKEDFVSERRIFKKGEEYPVYKRDGYYTLVADNGEFNFTEKGLSETIANWKDSVIVAPVEAQHDTRTD